MRPSKILIEFGHPLAEDLNKLNTPVLKEKADLFLKMHHGTRMLVLPNVWDVISARIFEEAGFEALATTSGGISCSLGYPDGERIPRKEMLEAVSRIASRLKVPLSADMESGYGSDEKSMEDLARDVLSAGAVGLNIEDSVKGPGKVSSDASLEDVDFQVSKIKAIRRASESLGVHLVINARCDSILRLRSTDERAKAAAIEQLIERGKAYSRAGADCIFAMFVKEREHIAKVVSSLDSPVNIIVGSGSLPLSELEKLGVARVSFGTSMTRATIGLLRRVGRELRQAGTYEGLADTITHEEMNKLALER